MRIVLEIDYSLFFRIMFLLYELQIASLVALQLFIPIAATTMLFYMIFSQVHNWLKHYHEMFREIKQAIRNMERDHEQIIDRHKASDLMLKRKNRGEE